MKIIAIIALLTFFCLTSCTDNRKASKSTFEKALNQFYSMRPPTVSSSFIKYPGVLSSKPQMMGPNKASIEALVNAKLIAFNGDTTLNNNVPGKKYDATDFGRKLLVEYPIITFFGKRTLQGFTFAKEQVTEIVSFSEPADLMGKKVSEVKYKSSLSNVAEWAKDPVIKEKFTKQYQSPNYSTQTKKAVLILTSEGWIHEQMTVE